MVFASFESAYCYNQIKKMNEQKKLDLKRRQRKRYRLHKKLLEEGFRLDARNRTIYPSESADFNNSKSAQRLVSEFGYNFQLVIE